uniref:Nucleotide-diphospho-sugar transferase domain-containing protein n=1 Tax=Panagrolaimus sp. JU765 TaxID=591449 RepID=A0AC34Q0X2_9BILA
MRGIKFVLSNSQTLVFPIHKRNITQRLSIAVVVVLGSLSQLKDYELAQKTIDCYCQYHGYPFFRIFLDEDEEYSQFCHQSDGMFKRHCVLQRIMISNPEYEYFVFLDADMGVVNPNHLFEEYIDPNYNVVLYERVFSYEVAAGSYIVKNTEFSNKFLQDWANYETKLPRYAFHGSDNSALHQLLLDYSSPTNSKKCKLVWEFSRTWNGVWRYIACVRLFLNLDSPIWQQIQIRPKGTKSVWVRDGWLTDSHWSPRDFLFHGWKTQKMNTVLYEGWLTPFAMEFDMEKCSSEKAHENWSYKDTFITTDEKVEKMLEKTIKNVAKQYENQISEWET